MKLNIYSIFDRAGAAFQTPFYMPMDNMAIRSFTHLVTDAASQVSKNPEDFDLHRLGSLDLVTGEVVAERQKLVTALEIANRSAIDVVKK